MDKHWSSVASRLQLTNSGDFTCRRGGTSDLMKPVRLQRAWGLPGILESECEIIKIKELLKSTLRACYAPKQVLFYKEEILISSPPYLFTSGSGLTKHTLALSQWTPEAVGEGTAQTQRSDALRSPADSLMPTTPSCRRIARQAHVLQAQWVVYILPDCRPQSPPGSWWQDRLAKTLSSFWNLCTEQRYRKCT